MAKEPKGLKVFGAGDSDYIKKMQEIGRKSGKTVKVPNPSNGKLTDVKPKPKSVAKPAVKVTVRVKPKAPATKTPMNKPKGLNDYLDKGKTPPSKNKKLPSDADVILKGYNDKKTIAKSKASTKKKGM